MGGCLTIAPDPAFLTSPPLPSHPIPPSLSLFPQQPLLSSGKTKALEGHAFCPYTKGAITKDIKTQGTLQLI